MFRRRKINEGLRFGMLEGKQAVLDEGTALPVGIRIQNTKHVSQSKMPPRGPNIASYRGLPAKKAIKYEKGKKLPHG